MKYDFSKFDRLAVHHELEIFQVTAHIIRIGGIKFGPSLPDVENVEVVIANFMTEMEIVGKAFVPGGTPEQVHPEPGRTRNREIKYFKFRVRSGGRFDTN
jgi:hypothetical protein